MCFINVQLIDQYVNYRPHPKDDGRLYFQSVHTCGGGGYPISGPGRGRYPIPGPGGGGVTPSQV